MAFLVIFVMAALFFPLSVEVHKRGVNNVAIRSSQDLLEITRHTLTVGVAKAGGSRFMMVTALATGSLRGIVAQVVIVFVTIAFVIVVLKFMFIILEVILAAISSLF